MAYRNVEDALRGVLMFPTSAGMSLSNLIGTTYMLGEAFEDLAEHAAVMEVSSQVRHTLQEGSRLVKKARAHAGHIVKDPIAAMSAVSDLITFIKSPALQTAAKEMQKAEPPPNSPASTLTGPFLEMHNKLKEHGLIAAVNPPQAESANKLVSMSVRSWNISAPRTMVKAANIMAAALGQMVEFGWAHILAHAEAATQTALTNKDLNQLREAQRLASHMEQLVHVPGLFYEQAALLARHMNNKDWQLAMSRISVVILESR